MLKPCDSLSIHVNGPFGTATLNVVGSSTTPFLALMMRRQMVCLPTSFKKELLINMSLFLTTDIYTSLKKKMR